MRKQCDLRLPGRFAVSRGLIAMGMLIAGCSAPNRDIAANRKYR